MTWDEARPICEDGTPVRRRSWPVTERDFRWLICQRGLFYEQQYQVGELLTPMASPTIETAFNFRAAEFRADDWITLADYNSTQDPDPPKEPFVETQTVVVPGSACVHFAYAPPGATASYNDGFGVKTDKTEDVAPPLLLLVPGAERVVISATGLVTNGPGGTYRNPDGVGDSGSYTTTPPYTSAALNSLGIPAFTAPHSALIGLWQLPSQTGSPFLVGSAAALLVPSGATGLYFGISDGYEWTGNPGSFSVTATMIKD